MNQHVYGVTIGICVRGLLHYTILDKIKIVWVEGCNANNIKINIQTERSFHVVTKYYFVVK